MICSNCGSPRTRYIKTLSKDSKKFSNEFLLENKIEEIDIYKCTTCGCKFKIKR